MKENLGNRLKHAWNAFFNRDPTQYLNTNIGVGNYYRPDRPRFSKGNERSIATAVYNRIAMDSAAMSIQHVKIGRASCRERVCQYV